MPIESKRSRFPRQAMIRRLGTIMDEMREYGQYYWYSAQDRTSQREQYLDLERHELLDQLATEIGGVMRSLSYWR